MIDETWSEGVVCEQSVPWERKRVAGGQWFINFFGGVVGFKMDFFLV